MERRPQGVMAMTRESERGWEARGLRQTGNRLSGNGLSERIDWLIDELLAYWRVDRDIRSPLRSTAAVRNTAIYLIFSTL